MPIDLINGSGAHGEVASRLQSNGQFNVGLMRPFADERTQKAYVTVYKGGDPALKTSWGVRPIMRDPINVNATLRHFEWVQLDKVLLEASRYRLGGVEDLIANGLTYQLGNAMGTTVLEWHDISDGMKAIVSMDGLTRGPNDRPNYQFNYLPIPIIHADYEINARELAASRNLGNPLDTSMAEQCARRIKEQLEDMLFTNTTFNYGAKDDRGHNTIYGYLNHPDRNAVHLSIPWDHSASTGAQILQDVQDMKAALVAAYHYGPYQLYIPSAYERRMDDDYDIAGASMMTIRERILKLGNIKGVKVVDTLTADNVLMVQMTPDVVRLVQGMGLQNVEWAVEGGMITKFKVMTIQVPQIRSDQNGRSGIAHLS
jgi:hypothetical protein